jgi:competence protein ComEC
MPVANQTLEIEVVDNRRLAMSGWYSLAAGWLESEYERLPLLIPVALGAGIAVWQTYGNSAAIPLLLFCSGILLLALSLGRSAPFTTTLLFSAMLPALGFAAISIKSELQRIEPLETLWIGTLAGRIKGVEEVSARGIVRYHLYLGKHPQLPDTVRVNVDKSMARAEFVAGAQIKMKARLMPPPGPALPGSYDFARTAWFDGIGATGRAIGSIELQTPAVGTQGFWGSARNSIAKQIQLSMGDESGAVGSALLVGARGGISETDAEALRNSGMAHLLSVSGLHVTAVVGGAFFLVASLLALWPWAALRISVPLVAAGFAALTAILYTLLTGAEVPTVRACVAALLILVALAIGREALSLRLLAAGATFVLLVWPEALAGPSFQLSFAAVGTIIVLHSSAPMQRFMARRDEPIFAKLMRGLIGLLLTGLAIELVLAPIALFHFHKSGIYGALANIVAIPLTTFIIMPAQLLGLLGDVAGGGIGSPFWFIASAGVALILWLAHGVSSAPGAVAMLPEMPVWAFGTAICSMLVLAVFRSKWRCLAVAPLLAAIVAMLTAPRPDMLVTGDGQHLAVLFDDGRLALLRPRAGDYARSILGETAAVKETAIAIDDMPGAKCNAEGCSFLVKRDKRNWRILALRSSYIIPAMELAAACGRADIVISSRRLPRSCKPEWVKADRAMLEQNGGLAFYLREARVVTVAEENAHHPWSAYSPERIARQKERRAKEKAARKPSPPSPMSVRNSQW